MRISGADPHPTTFLAVVEKLGGGAAVWVCSVIDDSHDAPVYSYKVYW
jgi:hypothetical protein